MDVLTFVLAYLALGILIAGVSAAIYPRNLEHPWKLVLQVLGAPAALVVLCPVLLVFLVVMCVVEAVKAVGRFARSAS